MTWLSYFFPQTLVITSSKYNQLIRVNEEFGKPKLLVNGSRQSGGYIKGLWEAAFKVFEIEKRSDLSTKGPTLSIMQILVLGVAGGTVIHLLNKIYPNAIITAVDIDKKMIDIGFKYFSLGTFKNLTVIEFDAKDYVRKTIKKNLKFDLIIVDLFSGREIPQFVESPVFLKALKKLLSDNGSIIINYLRELEYKEKSEKLANELKKMFRQVKDFEIKLNRFFFAS